MDDTDLEGIVRVALLLYGLLIIISGIAPYLVLRRYVNSHKESFFLAFSRAYLLGIVIAFVASTVFTFTDMVAYSVSFLLRWILSIALPLAGVLVAYRSGLTQVAPRKSGLVATALPSFMIGFPQSLIWGFIVLYTTALAARRFKNRDSANSLDRILLVVFLGLLIGLGLALVSEGLFMAGNYDTLGYIVLLGGVLVVTVLTRQDFSWSRAISICVGPFLVGCMDSSIGAARSFGGAIVTCLVVSYLHFWHRQRRAPSGS